MFLGWFHHQRVRSQGDKGCWVEGSAWGQIRQRKEGSWRPPDDPTQPGREETLCHDLTVWSMGQAILSRHGQVSSSCKENVYYPVSLTHIIPQTEMVQCYCKSTLTTTKGGWPWMRTWWWISEQNLMALLLHMRFAILAGTAPRISILQTWRKINVITRNTIKIISQSISHYSEWINKMILFCFISLTKHFSCHLSRLDLIQCISSSKTCFW